jgi:dienelactone hydrolase
MKLRYLLITGFIVALGACTSKQTETTEEREAEVAQVMEPDVLGEEITYSNGSIDMKGYIAYDKNLEGKRPGVLVVHEWWGHNEYARYRANKLAELGYVALAVDMYGDGKTAGHPDDAGKFTQEVVSNMDEATSRFTEALNTLNSHSMVDTEKTAAIGYCFGGSVVLSMANAGLDLDAVAAFHAGLGLPIQPEEGKVKARILVCNGADDPFIPQEQTDAWKKSMDDAGIAYTYVAYPGAVHSFTSPIADSLGAKFEMPLAYDEEADKQSWEELKSLFKEVFGE